MGIRYIDELTGIPKEVDFKPEIVIYIKKLAEEQNKTFDEIVNDIIAEHAMDKFKNKITYVPYVQPTTVSYNPYPYYDPNKINCTTSNIKVSYTNDDIINKTTSNNL